MRTWQTHSVISISDFVVFCNRTFDGYEGALDRLDDATVNQIPAAGPATASTPAQLVTHALGATAWWTEHMVAGQEIDRDRDAEFTVKATIAELREALADARRRLDAVAPALAAADGLTGEPSTQRPLGTEWTVGCALIHAYEELAQHLGHLEITTDLLAPA